MVTYKTLITVLIVASLLFYATAIVSEAWVPAIFSQLGSGHVAKSDAEGGDDNRNHLLAEQEDQSKAQPKTTVKTVMNLHEYLATMDSNDSAGQEPASDKVQLEKNAGKQTTVSLSETMRMADGSPVSGHSVKTLSESMQYFDSRAFSRKSDTSTLSQNNDAEATVEIYSSSLAHTYHYSNAIKYSSFQESILDYRALMQESAYRASTNTENVLPSFNGSDTSDTDYSTSGNSIVQSSDNSDSSRNYSTNQVDLTFPRFCFISTACWVFNETNSLSVFSSLLFTSIYTIIVPACFGGACI